jgi:hypothetical protein
MTVSGVWQCIWRRSLETPRFQSSTILRECGERPNVDWRDSFDGLDSELPEIEAGDHRNADSSTSNTGEIPCDARR